MAVVMGLTRSSSPLSRLLTTLLCSFSLAPSAAAQTVAAWHNSISAQVLVQDPITGDVYYSDCNSSGTPVFPTAPLNVFQFDDGKKPRNGSAFAATGYDAGSTIQAQIWYQSEDGRIWQALAQCSSSETQYTVTGTYEASAEVTTDISSTTGLAALLLSSSLGYRVFFHNSTGNVYQLVYTTDDGWGTGSPLSPDVPAGRSLSATFTDSSNMSIAYPLNSYSIEMSQFNDDDSYHDSAFPYPFSDVNVTDKATTAFTVNTAADVGSNALPNWDAQNATVGVAVDTKASKRRVFYLDTTGNLQYYLCDQAANISCTVQDRQPATIWPNGTASGSLGTAWNDDDRIVDLIYLDADDKLVMAEIESGSWNAATTLTDKAVSDWTTVGSATATTSSSSSTSTSTSSAATASGLSSGAKAGIAVAVVVVVGGGLVGLFVWWWLRRERKQRQEGGAAAAGAGAAGMAGAAAVAAGAGSGLQSSPGTAYKGSYDSTMPMMGGYSSTMPMMVGYDKTGLASSGGGGDYEMETKSMMSTSVHGGGGDGAYSMMNMTMSPVTPTTAMSSEIGGGALSNRHEVHAQSAPMEIDGRAVPRFELA